MGVSMTLHFTLKNHERRTDKIIRHTTGLIRAVLESLNYNGYWGVTFLCQQQNRTDKRWQPQRIDGNAILVKTKPLGNDSCWEMVLIPPKEYKINEVFDKFNSVHPRSLAVANSETVKLFGQEIKRPQFVDLKVKHADLVQRNIKKTLESIEIIVDAPKADAPKVPALPDLSRVGEARRTEVPVPAKQERQWEKFVPPPPKQTQPWKVGKPLALDPLWFPITDHRIAMNALIAATTVLDMHTGHCPRKLVIATVERELNLEYWLNKHRRINEDDKVGYTNMLGLVREIVSVLVDRKFLTRYGTTAKTPPIRFRTAGYMITAEGRKKIEAWKQYMPEEIISRLYSGDYGKMPSSEESFDEEEEEVFADEIVAKELPPVTQEEPQDKKQTIELIASRLGQLTPLIDRHDKLVADLKEYDAFIDPTRGSVEAAGFIVEGIKAKIIPLQKELDRLQFQLSEAETKFAKAQEDLDYVIGDRKIAADKLAEIQTELKALLG
jgi:hypothetical protein